MNKIMLFKTTGDVASEIMGTASNLEKPLQTFIERNLDALLSIRFVKSEHPTGKVHGGRIDTLGLDENSCPVIIEYKRSADENVINQGLFYLDWLMDHQAEFKLLVMERLGAETAEKIDWLAPRLICVASDFTRYDSHAVQQIDRNIELFRYRKFGDELFLLELTNATSSSGALAAGQRQDGKSNGDKTVAQAIAELSPPMRELFDSLENYLMSLGDDVQRKDLKLYVAFKRIRNFTCVVVLRNKLALNVDLDPDKVELVDGFTRDMRGIGHWGTGDLEITLNNLEDLERAKAMLRVAYEGG